MSLLFRENDPLAPIGERRTQAFSPGDILLGQIEPKNPPASGPETGNGWFSLSAPVGRDSAPNRKQDVAKVETLLGQTGHYDIQRLQGPTGFWGMVGDKAVKDFQKQNGLKVDGLLNPGGPTISALEGRVGDIFKNYTPPTVDQIDAHHQALSENAAGLLTFGRPPLRMASAGEVASDVVAANKRTLSYLSGYSDNQGLDQAAAKHIVEGEHEDMLRYRDLIWRMSQSDPRRAHGFAWGILDHLPEAKKADFLGFEAPQHRPVGVRRNEWDGRRTMELRPEDEKNAPPPRAQPYYPDRDDGKNFMLKAWDDSEKKRNASGDGGGDDGVDAPLDLRDDLADPGDDASFEDKNAGDGDIPPVSEETQDKTSEEQA
ncbi:MAG: peptidoglycan-binding protein [Rhodospirillales bacterium]|nr:peptidoglycan-binding protein [Rhodospirillales bacterium]